jgi:hypothetical protein
MNSFVIMIIEIKKPVTKQKVTEIFARIAGESKKKSLRKHFGKLKRNLDGVTCQKQMRNDWL